jgi:hypothetical protein
MHFPAFASMKRVDAGSVLRAARTGASLLLALLLLAQAAAPVLAQESIPSWVPQPQLDPVVRWAKRILGLVIWASTILMILLLIGKWSYGQALTRTGMPGVTMRGFSELWEALSGFFWLFVGLIVPPWVVFLASLANLVPPWLASQINDIFTGFWQDLFGAIGGSAGR